MRGQPYSSLNRMISQDKEILISLMDKLQQGVELDTPVIDHKNKTQEGLHRAMAARMIGMKVIPVIEVDRAYPIGKFHIPRIYDQNGNVIEYEDRWE